MSKIICGVDVDSRFLQARIGPNGPAGRFANTAKGIAKLAEFCHQHQVELVAMEATGGYEKRPFALLWAQGIAWLFLTLVLCATLPKVWVGWKKPIISMPA